MGHQIIKQPDGLLAVWDATPGELEDWYADQAAAEARERTRRVLALIEENPRRAYYQFTLTFAEANEKSVAHDGPDLSEKLTGDAADA
jgi:inosine/xanthosine triphosphate pyrophosphatase family protein